MDNTVKQIKVLQVAGSMNVGGIENQLMHLLRQADSTEFQIDFTSTEEHPFYKDEILSLGARCIQIPSTNGKHLFRYCRSLYHVLKNGQYEIVHTHELYHSGLVLLTARLAGVKHRFVHAHSSNQTISRNPVRRFYHALMRWLILRFGTEFFACSTLSAEFLYGKGILAKPNYHLVVNSVETDRFLPGQSAANAASDHKDGIKTVLQVGRFSDEKNFIFTTRVANECKKRNYPLRFWFVGNSGGDNPLEAEVLETIEADSLQDRVQLLGVRKDIDALMRQADLFVLPSKHEGMPLTLIEAQAACLPCVAADTFSHEVDFGVGAIKWLPLGQNAVSEWAEALFEWAAHGKTDPALVKKAIAEKGFDVRSFARTLCAMYKAAACGDGNEK